MNPAANLDFVVEQHWTLGVWFRHRKAHDLDRARRELEPQLTFGILQYRPDLDKLRDECPQAAVGWQPLEYRVDSLPPAGRRK